EHVLETTGLTYAEYARQGFGELIAVACMTLGVIALADRLANRDAGSTSRRLKLLLGILCALTLVVLASALKRLGLYEDAFGFTRTRLAADGVILWLAGVFALVAWAGLANAGRRLPRAIAALTGAALIAFTVMNPDAIIAGRNIDRYELGGRIDLGYLSHLSADAVPSLARLDARHRSCALGRLRKRLSGGDGVVGANVSRARARSRLAGVHDADCTIAME
ncbi:MAG: DUF4173 domain-containing protein, partial [Thermoleophilaceae bacterium]